MNYVKDYLKNLKILLNVGNKNGINIDKVKYDWEIKDEEMKKIKIKKRKRIRYNKKKKKSNNLIKEKIIDIDEAVEENKEIVDDFDND